MAVDFRVRVITAKQEPIEGIRVVLKFTRLTLELMKRAFTDMEGYAHFKGETEGEVNVFIMGTEYGKFQYLHGKSVTVVL